MFVVAYVICTYHFDHFNSLPCLVCNNHQSTRHNSLVYSFGMHLEIVLCRALYIAFTAFKFADGWVVQFLVAQQIELCCEFSLAVLTLEEKENLKKLVFGLEVYVKNRRYLFEFITKCIIIVFNK